MTAEPSEASRHDDPEPQNPDPINRPMKADPRLPATIMTEAEVFAAGLWDEGSGRQALDHMISVGRDMTRRLGIAERFGAHQEARAGAFQHDLVTANEELGRRQNRIDAQARDHAALIHEHADFKARVRTAAIEHASAQGECDDGLNEWLEELGLDKVKRSWEVVVEVIYEKRVVTLTIEEAEDEDDAREQGRKIAEGLDWDDSEWDDDPEIDSVSVESVERSDA